METIGVTLNRGKTEMAKGAISQALDFVGKFFHSKRTTKTVAAEKYNPLPQPPKAQHTHTYPEPKYTCNKEGEIKALIQ